MKTIEKIKRGKYNLLYKVIPYVVIAAIIKIIIHYLDFEVLPKELISFLPSILTGIIFILGFMLAGVMSDYKESEKIPNELATSLYVIWQEAITVKNNHPEYDVSKLLGKLKLFIPAIKKDFFIDRNKQIYENLNSFSYDFHELEKYTHPPFIARLKNEQANIRKLLNRIEIIKDTDFSPTVFVSLKAISITFLFFYSLLQLNPWWGGLLLLCIFTFVIFSLILVINDLEDPFEYDDEGPKSDEIDLSVLDKLHKEINS